MWHKQNISYISQVRWGENVLENVSGWRGIRLSPLLTWRLLLMGTTAILQPVSEQIRKFLLGRCCENVNTGRMSRMLLTYTLCWGKHQKQSFKESWAWRGEDLRPSSFRSQLKCDLLGQGHPEFVNQWFLNNNIYWSSRLYTQQGQRSQLSRPARNWRHRCMFGKGKTWDSFLSLLYDFAWKNQRKNFCSK